MQHQQTLQHHQTLHAMSHPTTVSCLEQVPVFKGLSEDSLKRIAELTETVEFARNAIVVQAGDIGDSMYIIAEGSLRVYRTDSQGKRIIFSILAAGDYFGEMALIDGKERSASIAANEPSTLIRLAKKEFDALVEASPTFRRHLLVELCQRLRAANQKISNLAHMDVYGRIAGLLMECAEPHDGYYIVREHLTHQDIADRIGSSREMVSRILRDLIAGRYITQNEDKSITICKHLPNGW